MTTKNRIGAASTSKVDFFGLSVYLQLAGHGLPIEFVVLPGSVSDIEASKEFDLVLPEGSLIHADRACSVYKEEGLLIEAAAIVLQP